MVLGHLVDAQLEVLLGAGAPQIVRQRGYVQEHVARIATEHLSSQSQDMPTAAEGAPGFNIHAYICGLNDMVSANRERLTSLGWDKKQIIFERYD